MSSPLFSASSHFNKAAYTTSSKKNEAYKLVREDDLHEGYVIFKKSSTVDIESIVAQMMQRVTETLNKSSENEQDKKTD